MQAAEFQTKPGADHSIHLPDEISNRLPPGKSVRILLLWEKEIPEYDDWTDEEWSTMSMMEMASSYSDDEPDYADLLEG